MRKLAGEVPLRYVAPVAIGCLLKYAEVVQANRTREQQAREQEGEGERPMDDEADQEAFVPQGVWGK